MTATANALGRKTGETVNFGAFSKGYSYSYDALGNKASFTGPDGTTYSYGYTKIHQPSTIAWGGYAIAYSYQWDRLTKQALPNGVETDYSYNLNGWLNQISAKASSGTTILDYQYGYENVGNIVSKTTESGSYQYNYDDLYRLISAQNPASIPSESFSYDKVGNRLSSADASNWTYNQNNALVSYGSINYSYDPNGNTVSKNASGQITSFIYNSKDRLEQVNLPDGKIAVYKYDPFNRRISKTVDGVTTYFVYAEEGLVAEIDNAGNVVKTYGWKPGSTWGTDPVLLSEGGNTYFYHNDHLGTPQKMTDATGAVAWSATYTAFGEATVDAASTITNNLRFPGQYYDVETGLHYNLSRYYDPKTGTYITADPIGLGGGINTYLYVGGNPIYYSDKYGLYEWYEPEGATEYWENYGVQGLQEGGIAGYSKGAIAAIMNATISLWGLQEIANNSREAGNVNCSAKHRLWAGAKVIGQIILTSGLADEAIARFGGKYWQYFTKGTESTSKWMVRGPEPPYELGEEARNALNLPPRNLATDVKEVKVKWYEPVRGPATPIAQPNFGWPNPGNGIEYYRGLKWDGKYWFHSSLPPAP